MARRSAAQVTTTQATSSSTPAAEATTPDDLLLLRRQWKWAAFCQFFYTFASLFNMPDISIAEIEQDLIHSGAIVLPRIMVRLLHTLTQDKKINLDNWQLALRRQYARREPDSDPLASLPEEPSPSPESSPPPHNSVASAVSDDLAGKELLILSSSIAGVVVGSQDGRGSTPGATSDMATNNAKSQESSADNSMDAPVGDVAEVPTEALVDLRPQDWLDLSMLGKLDSMHTMTEWQFHNVNRFRTTMKSDDEYASWRIEPIGYDAKANAYWLIAENRLWIQRQPPAARNARKRKRAPKASAPDRNFKRVGVDVARKSRNGKVAAASASSSRANSRPIINKLSAPQRTSSRQRPTPSAAITTPRAAKMQANIKLDEQAKQLAALQKQANVEAKEQRPLGTRVSSRLRGSVLDDGEWQQIPQDWLDGEGGKTNGTYRARNGGGRQRTTRSSAAATDIKGRGKVEMTKKAKASIGLDSDDDSDLTELSDDEHEVQSDLGEGEADATLEEEPESSEDESPPPPPPDDFVEWETICVSLQEWENIADRFKDSTHYLEKALCKVLMNDIVSVVTEELKEAERAKRLEEAIVTRKRSSRIAVKATQKEEAVAAAAKKAEEEKELARARRLEARQKKEEADREKRENAREQRRLEREAKEEQARLRDEAKTKETSVDVDVVGTTAPHLPSSVDPGRRSYSSATGSSSSVGANGRWELDCEGCQRRGVNLDDGLLMISCARCARRQHVICHDTMDRDAGRRPRDWQRDAFLCQRCRSAAPPAQTSSNTSLDIQLQPATNGHGRPYGHVALQVPRQGVSLTGSIPSPQVTPYGWNHNPQVPSSYRSGQPTTNPVIPNMHAHAQATDQHNTMSRNLNGHAPAYPPHGTPSVPHYYQDSRAYSGSAPPTHPHYPPQPHVSQIPRNYPQPPSAYSLDTRAVTPTMQAYGNAISPHQPMYMSDTRAMGKPQGPLTGQQTPDVYMQVMGVTSRAALPARPDHAYNGSPTIDSNPQGSWPAPPTQVYAQYPGYGSPYVSSSREQFPP